MRLSGLASGFDTDSMVQDLMKVERLKVDRYTQRKQVNQWRQEEYSNMNKNIANFILNSQRNMGLRKPGSNVVNAKVYNNLDYLRKAESSNENVASVKVISKASIGNFTLDVERLEENSSYVSGKLDSKDLVSGDIKIGDISLGNYEDGVSLNKLVKDINENEELKELGVTAFYDKGTGRIFIQGDPENNLELTGVQVQSLEEDGSYSEARILEEGKSNYGNFAQVKINGVEVDGASIKGNKFTFNGVEIQLKDVGKDIKIGVTNNTDEAIDRIKGLVDEYNQLLDTISKAVNEKRYPSFHPLSNEEKEAMTDKDIELWEEKAKSGMLHKDESLNRMMSKIRVDMFKNVEGLEGSFKNITEIGITTVKYSKGAAGGKLQIDEAKLRQALEDDADGVMELLFAEEKKDLEFDSKRTSNRGVFTGVYDNMIDGMKSIIDKSGPGEDSDLLRDVRSNILIDFVTKRGSISDIDREIKNMERKIEDLEVLLGKKEDAYYAQFTAMEKYLYEMNSQSNWLMQQMM